jgi:ribosomal protein S18 acetylase RimI-like enzyme
MIKSKPHLINQYSTQFTYLNIESLSPGTATYFARLSVLPEMMGRGIGKRLVYESCKYQMERGYQHAIIGSIVEVSLHMFTKMGG